MARYVMRLICGFFLVSSILLAIDVDSIRLGGKTTSMNLLIVKQNRALYIPIRELMNALDVELNYRPKYHLYECSRGPKTFQFAAFSDYIHYENTIHFLAHSPIMKYNRLYIPINELSDFLGWSAHLNGSQLVFTETKPKYAPAHHAKAPMSASAYDEVLLPDLMQEHQAWLQTPKAKINLLSHLIEHKDIAYISLSPFAEILGLKISKEENRIILTGQGRSVRLVTNSAQTYITQKGGKPQSARNQGPPITRNGRTYVPLTSMIQRLGFAFSWETETRTLALLTPIYDIQLTDRKLVVLGAQSVTPRTSHESSRIYIDLPFAHLNQSISLPSIKKFPFLHVEQLTATTVRIWGRNRYDTHTGQISQENSKTTIQFVDTLQDIRSKLTHNAYQIIIPNVGKLDHKIVPVKNKRTLVIDFNHARSQLPAVFSDPTQPIFSTIRTSQFKKTPAITRLVVDLKKSRHYTIKSSRYGTTLQFELSPPELARVRHLRSPQNSLRYKTITLDAGHGGRDPGAIGIYKEQEKIYTMDITNRLKTLLESNGARVIMTRVGDQYRSLSSRAVKSNESRSNIFVSIHVNSFSKSYANGTETYYYKYKDKPLARFLQKSMSKILSLKDNGVKRANLYVLRHTNMPSALVEPAFLTHPKENKLMKSSQFRQNIAQSLYQGLVAYFQSKK